MTPEVLDRLKNFPFPGNVRELETEVQRMVAVTEQGGYIALRHLSEKISSTHMSDPGVSNSMPFDSTLKEKVESLERSVLVQALESRHWNQS